MKKMLAGILMISVICFIASSCQNLEKNINKEVKNISKGAEKLVGKAVIEKLTEEAGYKSGKDLADAFEKFVDNKKEEAGDKIVDFLKANGTDTDLMIKALSSMSDALVKAKAVEAKEWKEFIDYIKKKDRELASKKNDGKTKQEK
ncbi:MAG: hypothetical protein JXA60_12985 [Candidatus Coatesbacteria bacterium]|nr:hypothetical protein [Candidatus Coatesbacteria bacterium]